METFPALLALCVGNSPVTGEFPSHRPVTLSFDDRRLNKQLSKQSWGWWFETTLRPLWRHCNVGIKCDYCTCIVVWDISRNSWQTTKEINLRKHRLFIFQADKSSAGTTGPFTARPHVVWVLVTFSYGCPVCAMPIFVPTVWNNVRNTTDTICIQSHVYRWLIIRCHTKFWRQATSLLTKLTIK